MKQTALTELKEKIEHLRSNYWEKLCPLSPFDEVAGNLASQISTIDIILKEVEPLLELEKQQIVDAWIHAETRAPENIKHINNAENYYNETFNPL